MSSTIVLPQGTYPIGTRTLGPATVPLGATSVQLQLDGTSMTDQAMAMSMTLDLSLDAGVTWASDSPSPATNPFPVSCTLNGGAKNRAGGPLATYLIGTQIPAPSNTQRRIRAVIVISGAPLTTQGTLVLT